MNYNSIPLIAKGTFIREEESGAILIPITGNVNATIRVNETGLAILKLCNSENTIIDIIEKLKIQFDDDDIKSITDDVIKFINLMKKKKIIICNLQDSISIGNNVHNDGKNLVHRCGEQDLKTIRKYIEANETTLYIGNKLKFNKKYIMDNINNFYLLNNNSNTLAVLVMSSIQDKNFNIYEIVLLEAINDFELISYFINICINDLNRENKLNKVRLSIKSNIDYKFIEVLKKLGFQKSVILKNEFGANIDKIILEKI